MSEIEKIPVYKSNHKLKAAGVQQEFTTEQIIEYARCEGDIVYFVEKYVKIIHVDKGIVPFKLWEFQKDMIRNMEDNRFTIYKLSRQVGKTTVAAAFILHYLIFNPTKLVAILANKGSQAREILGRVKMAYEELPLWMQVGVKEWNKGSIELGNGSRAVAAATGSSAVRGMSISCLYLDEFAFVHSNMATEFFESVYPTVSSGSETKIIITSTPKGMNHFYKMWVEAEEGRSKFIPFSINWWDVPARDEKWKEETISNIGEESFEQEYAAEFLGSSNTLIAGSFLRKLVHLTPISENKTIRIYEEPKPGRRYFMACDISRGSGIDYSVLQVIDISSYPFKQVALFRDNKTNHYVMPRKIAEIAKSYNEAFVLIEINDIGEAVADAVYFDEEYENLLTTGESKGKIALGSWKNSKNGLRTTKSTKREGCSIFKALVESGKLEIRDFETINEMSTFILKGNSYEADDMCHDDCVMALVVFAWATGQEYFKDISEKDVRKTFVQEATENILEELTPLGFWGDHRGDDGEWQAV